MKYFFLIRHLKNKEYLEAFTTDDYFLKNYIEQREGLNRVYTIKEMDSKSIPKDVLLTISDNISCGNSREIIIDESELFITEQSMFILNDLIDHDTEFLHNEIENLPELLKFIKFDESELKILEEGFEIIKDHLDTYLFTDDLYDQSLLFNIHDLAKSYMKNDTID